MTPQRPSRSPGLEARVVAQVERAAREPLHGALHPAKQLGWEDVLDRHLSLHAQLEDGSPVAQLLRADEASVHERPHHDVLDGLARGFLARVTRRESTEVDGDRARQGAVVAGEANLVRRQEAAAPAAGKIACFTDIERFAIAADDDVYATADEAARRHERVTFDDDAREP